ncbi:MAG: extracellular solute-binding protein [Rhizobiaceae bacterium]|nr:extracellular solute-binding protein [Rhizobiaceae bacterium]
MSVSRAINRRTVLAGGAVALAAPYLARPARADAALRLLTWEGYAEDAWVKPFEEKTGAKVNITYVGSADEMFAKMQGSKGADFDLATFDTSAFKRYLDAGLLAPVDASKLTAGGNLQPEFRDVAAIKRDGNVYGVPFAWGSLPLIYSKPAFPDSPPDWNAMWNPDFAQQIIMQDDANNCITLGAIVVGVKDPFNLTDADFEAVKAKLIEQKPLLLTYFAGFDEGVTIFAQSDVKLMYSMGEPQLPALKKKGVDAALTIPPAGAIGWLDCWTVSSGAQNMDLVYKWLDACLDPAVGAYLSEKLGYGNTTNPPANQASGVTYGDKLIWLQTPENIEKRVQIWNEVKAAG